MREPWKIGAGLLALALLILMCPFLSQLMPGSGADWSGYLELSEDKIHFWVERERESNRIKPLRMLIFLFKSTTIFGQ